MQITIEPGWAASIILAIIGGCVWIVQSQSKTREAIMRVALKVEEMPALTERVRQLELAQASGDPKRHLRMHPLSRAREDDRAEQEG